MTKLFTLATLLRMLANTKMRPMTESELSGYMGVESSDALIGEVDNCILIVDGDRLCVISHDEESGETSESHYSLQQVL